ncbi:MAG: protein translocase subunit SecD [Myxococcales bacterium]|nr:MAG: protein translocase subunit SecD [Myxococcales bacterium]
MNRLRLRAATIGALVLLPGTLTLANFVPAEVRQASPFLPDTGLRLGLDLQGGIHWILGVQLDEAVTHELDYVRSGIQGSADEGDFRVDLVVVEGDRVVVEAAGEEDLAKLREWAVDRGGLEVQAETGRRLEFGLDAPWRAQVRERGMEQVLEVLRRRIDDPVTGIPESVVTRQGEDRILVEIPGGQIERSRAREMLRVTGFLEFKIVQDQDKTEELLLARYAGVAPEGMELAFEREKETNRVLNAYLMTEKADVTGDFLTDARVQFDRQNRPTVGFTFNGDGGGIFGRLTQENIGKQLAIVLDDRVYSAPVIRSQITIHGQIEGRFTAEEAADLAVVLRAGSLPVPVAIEEERLVGPALGADSIARGFRASVLALAATLVFAVIYYKRSGLYAAAALLANILMLLGIMSLFEATLPLPGMAGIVLTLGMAIDANVIIFERIREEMREGKTPRAAIHTGFNRAYWTIMDANITTLITALVLYEYGTGPIKGFAVTLSIGIVTSVFAALVITRILFEFYPGDRPVESLSI